MASPAVDAPAGSSTPPPPQSPPSGGSGGPSGNGPRPPKPPPPPGLRDQLAATVGAARRLLDAHVSLARLELGGIVAEAKWIVALAGIAVAFLVFAALLVAVGGILFVGEWIFGSIGWGVLHGLLFCVAVAVIALLAALRVSTGQLARAFLLALGLGIVVGVVLGTSWTNTGWTRLGESLLPGVDPAPRPLLTAIVVSGVVAAVLGFLLGASRAAPGERVIGAVLGLLGGAVVGAALGAISAVAFSTQVGSAIGLAVGLATWPILGALALRGYDWEALKARFTPTVTMETTQETFEWIRQRTPGGKRS